MNQIRNFEQWLKAMESLGKAMESLGKAMEPLVKSYGEMSAKLGEHIDPSIKAIVAMGKALEPLIKSYGEMSAKLGEHIDPSIKAIVEMAHKFGKDTELLGKAIEAMATKEKRIRAYGFIKDLFKNVNWVDADLTKDNDLASVLDVFLSDLILLKEGKINPSRKVVESVKCFFKNDPNITLARQIEQILVEPF